MVAVCSRGKGHWAVSHRAASTSVQGQLCILLKRRLERQCQSNPFPAIPAIGNCAWGMTTDAGSRQLKNLAFFSLPITTGRSSFILHASCRIDRPQTDQSPRKTAAVVDNRNAGCTTTQAGIARRRPNFASGAGARSPLHMHSLLLCQGLICMDTIMLIAVIEDGMAVTTSATHLSGMQWIHRQQLFSS